MKLWPITILRDSAGAHESVWTELEKYWYSAAATVSQLIINLICIGDSKTEAALTEQAISFGVFSSWRTLLVITRITMTKGVFPPEGFRVQDVSHELVVDPTVRNRITPVVRYFACRLSRTVHETLTYIESVRFTIDVGQYDDIKRIPKSSGSTTPVSRRNEFPQFSSVRPSAELTGPLDETA